MSESIKFKRKTCTSSKIKNNTHTHGQKKKYGKIKSWTKLQTVLFMKKGEFIEKLILIQTVDD